MDVPQEFASRLDREFEGRLRIRWSRARGEWQVEQKVGRAALPPIRVTEVDDDAIRARDGYSYVLSVRPGTSMPCPDCGTTLPVPALQFKEVVCTRCQLRDKHGKHPAGYFPLSDLLIDHLKKIAPERADRRRLREMDARNAALLQQRERDIRNAGEAGVKEHWNRIAGIESVGYTGREFKGAV